MSRMSRRRAAMALLVLLASYAAAEAVVTTRAALRSRPATWVVCEGEGDLFTFEPRTGLRISPEPWRMAQVHRGQVEFVSEVDANALGWPDRDDFGPQRTDPVTPRVAVFGDSFTAGMHLQTNWPDRVEEGLALEDRPVELLNLSQAGIGLPNWWSTAMRVLQAEHWEVDAVLFAVWGDDLGRAFHVAHAPAGAPILRGPVPAARPDAWPETLEQARRWMRPVAMYRVSPDEFGAALAGRWTPPGRWHPRIAGRLIDSLGGWWQPIDAAPDETARARVDLVDDLAAWIARRRMRGLVVFIPPRRHLLGEPPTGAPVQRDRDAARWFAERIGARFLDGELAFAGVPVERRDRLFPVHDGHWNQRGSDRFAEFIQPRVAMLVDGLPDLRRP